jgi:chromosome segregation ATPase
VGFQAAIDDQNARLATIMDDLADEKMNVNTLNDLLANTKEHELAALEALVVQLKADFAEACQQELESDTSLTKLATSLRLKQNEVLRLEARIREALVTVHAPRKAVVARNPDTAEQPPLIAHAVAIKSIGGVNTGSRAPRSRKSTLPLDEKRRKKERGQQALVLHTTTGFESRTAFYPQDMPGVVKKVNTVLARSSAPGLNVQQNNILLRGQLNLL